MNDKISENRIRRMADRQGFTLAKSKRRDPRALDYGKFMLLGKIDRAAVEVETGANVMNGFTLSQIEAWLTDDQRSQKTDQT